MGEMYDEDGNYIGPSGMEGYGEEMQPYGEEGEGDGMGVSRYTTNWSIV